MASALRPGRVAGVTALLGVVALAMVGYLMATYEPPSNGGTSLAGLFFAVVIFVAVVTLVEAGLLAAYARWGPSSVWPRRLLVVGVSLGGLASLSAVLYQLPAVPPAESLLWDLLHPFSGHFFAATLLFTLLGVAGSGLGLLATLIAAVSSEG